MAKEKNINDVEIDELMKEEEQNNEPTLETEIVEDSKEYYLEAKLTHILLIEDSNGSFYEGRKLTEEEAKNSKNAFKIDELPPSKYNFFILKDGKLLANEAKNLEIDTANRYAKLEQIFKDKWVGIQAIAIDKEWMTDPQAIQDQIDSYSKLAEGAREILKNDPENETALAIVEKADEAKLLTFQANALMQKVRGILEEKIAQNDPKIDEKLAFAESFKMSKEDISDTKKSAEMATQLITYLMS